MAAPSTVAPRGATIAVNVFDGSRQPVSRETNILFTIRDGNQREVFRDYRRASSVTFKDLTVFDNFGDNYTVLAWAEGYEQAGFTPVHVRRDSPQNVDLLLLNKNASFNFRGAAWDTIKRKRPAIARLLPRDLYVDTIEHRPSVIACFLNITTAMAQINLPSGTPLDYMKEVICDQTLAQDRFFAWADAEIVGQVRRATDQGLFSPEPGSSIFHPGATSSYKQVQFGEANLQLTFHEDDRRTIGTVECVKVESDIDYYQDKGAHALLEVLKNGFSGSLTDPRIVYVLRWIAGRHAGVPDFDPLYTIV